MQGSKARKGHAAIFRDISKWAAHNSHSAGRNSWENFEFQGHGKYGHYADTKNMPPNSTNVSICFVW
jgi:hypothetical protein